MGRGSKFLSSRVMTDLLIPDEKRTVMSFQVRIMEVDHRQLVTMPTLIDWLQETASQAAEQVAVSIPQLQEAGLTWVMHRMQVTSLQPIRYGDAIQIVTYAPCAERFLGQRDFLVFHEGLLVAKAATQWLVINIHTHKLASIPDVARERLLRDDVTPIPVIKQPLHLPDAPTYKLDIGVRWHHLDYNKHVNHGNYIRWGLDAVYERLDHEMELEFLDVQFKGQSFLGDQLRITAQASNDLNWIHGIHNQKGEEVLRMATRWKNVD